ncbi:hypothetical protein BASA81_001277 [Batrachochytrium salamandrivorans]|nr:hypothetical protein BASA81_001277 [Batrachochytrium salamandrivorans]
MPAPPVRVYLDQKLKFWMAFVGAVTLFYLSVLDSRLLFPPTAPAFVLLVVHPDHKSQRAVSPAICGLCRLRGVGIGKQSGLGPGAFHGHQQSPQEAQRQSAFTGEPGG